QERPPGRPPGAVGGETAVVAANGPGPGALAKAPERPGTSPIGNTAPVEHTKSGERTHPHEDARRRRASSPPRRPRAAPPRGRHDRCGLTTIPSPARPPAGRTRRGGVVEDRPMIIGDDGQVYVTHGNERPKRTHPERLKRTHLDIQNSRFGQWRQL